MMYQNKNCFLIRWLNYICIKRLKDLIGVYFMHIPGTFFARNSRFSCRTSTRHQYLKCIWGFTPSAQCCIPSYGSSTHSSLTYFVSENVLNTTPIGACYRSDTISSLRADQGPFSAVLEDMFSTEFGQLNFASNISNVSLCPAMLMMRVLSLYYYISCTKCLQLNILPCWSFLNTLVS